MSFIYSLRISAAGMSAQRRRLDVIAGNLANQQTTRTPAGGPYRRQDVVFAAEPLPVAEEEGLSSTGEETALMGVRVAGIITDPRPPVLKYEPGHPDADARGYVAYPNVNPIEEMVNMLSAARSYEANLTMLKTAKEMANRTVEVLKI